MVARLPDADGNGVPDLLEGKGLAGLGGLMGSLFADADGNGVPDIMEGKGLAGLMTHGGIVINGVTYPNPRDIPPEAREQLRANLKQMLAGGTNPNLAVDPSQGSDANWSAFDSTPQTVQGNDA